MDIAMVSFFALLHFGVMSSMEMPLTCSKTAKGNLSDIYRKFDCELHYFPKNNSVKCNSLMSWYETRHTKLTFRVLEEITDVSNGTDYVSFCIGLDNYQLGYYGQDYWPSNGPITCLFSFDSSMTVGVLIAERRAWETNRTFDLNILDEILELGIFDITKTAYMKDFWNFSPSLFGTNLRWFKGLTVTGGTQSLPSNALESLENTSIQTLELIACIEEDKRIFLVKNMPLLRKLRLDGNEITAFHNDTFTETSEVEELILVRNYLHEIPTIIERIPKLRVLRISSFHPELPFQIRTDQLQCLTKLEDLNLSYTNLTSISKKFPFMSNLKKLDLSNCQISLLGMEDFTNFPNLQELNLSRNHLLYMDESVFLPLKHLKKLDLSKNLLTEWPFLQENSMDFLNLSYNSLKNISNLGSDGTTVDILNLSNNKIESWEDTSIFSLRKPDSSSTDSINETLWVKNMDLSNNSIVGVSEAMIESLNGIQQLDLGGNHFDCIDCRMIPFQKWLNTTSSNVTNLGKNDPLLCSSPRNHEDEPILEVEFDEEPCLEKQMLSENLWFAAGIPSGIIFTLLLICGLVTFHFRAHIAYVSHLYKIRKRAQLFSNSDDNQHAFDAFVVYSSHDRRFVLTQLAVLLEKGPERYVLCLHERDFPLGSRIVDNIVDSIEHSRKTILVLSQHFIDSKWCQWEFDMANHKMFNDDEHFLILIELEKLDRANLNLHLKFLLDTRTYLEWPPPGHKNETKALERLKMALGPSIFQTTHEEAPSLSTVMGECEL